jgi:hypothetical protein
MDENSDNRLPAGLICLLIYQGIVVLVSLFFVVNFWLLFLTYRDYSFVLGILVLACWATAMSYASVAMMWRSPRGFLVGMICHLILEIPALPLLLFLGFEGVVGILSETGLARGFAEMFLIFALMWLPFVLISGWGFFYLRKLRKGLLT